MADAVIDAVIDAVRFAVPERDVVTSCRCDVRCNVTTYLQVFGPFSCSVAAGL